MAPTVGKDSVNAGAWLRKNSFHPTEGENRHENIVLGVGAARSALGLCD